MKVGCLGFFIYFSQACCNSRTQGVGVLSGLQLQHPSGEGGIEYFLKASLAKANFAEAILTWITPPPGRDLLILTQISLPQEGCYNFNPDFPPPREGWCNFNLDFLKGQCGK